MKTKSYIKKYEDNKGRFEIFFGDNAKLYWKIWELHNVGKISYDKLALHYGYVKSSIKNICDRVEGFLDNPRMREEKNISLEELAGSIMYPNKFIYGYGANTLSLNAHKIFLETIYLYQHGLNLEIPRDHIMSFSTQYKNTDRRSELFEELRNLQIWIGEGEIIKVFTKVDDNKGAMIFEFTEVCLDYIDPWRYFLKNIAIDGLSKSVFVDQ